MRSVLVRTGHRGEDGKHGAAAGAVCDNVLDAVRHILKNDPA
jgi:hypothetical protein